ncbi:MAG: TonB-dependent receptor plug domain-containing protein, partial [Syntrophothermus sp.]
SSTFGAYFQLEQNLFQKLSANYGLRFDYTKTEDVKSQNSLSPRVGINYKLNDFMTLRSNLSYGFRSPSLAEVFTTTTVSGITIRPNLNLLPENNYTFEAGTLLKFNPLNIDAAIYYSKYKKFIEAVVEPSGRFIHFENLADAEIKGFEISLSTKMINDLLNVKAGYNFNLATDINTKKMLKYRSKHIFNTNVGFNFEPFAVGFDYRFLSKPEEIDWLLVDLGIVPEGNKIVDIHVFDFYTSYNLLILEMPIKLFFNIKNLFNYNYVEMIGNLGPIRNYSLTVELNL